MEAVREALAALLAGPTHRHLLIAAGMLFYNARLLERLDHSPARQRQAMLRDQVLAEAGTALMGARDRQRICELATEAAVAMPTSTGCAPARCARARRLALYMAASAARTSRSTSVEPPSQTAMPMLPRMDSRCPSKTVASAA